MKKLEIILFRSLIGAKPNQIKNAHSLGLRKINQKVIKENTKVVQGVLKKINHLVLVKEIFEKEI